MFAFLFPNRGFQLVHAIQPFPRQVEIVPAKVAVGRRLAVDGSAQVERFDDRRGAEVKHPLYRALNRLVVEYARAERINRNRHRPR